MAGCGGKGGICPRMHLPGAEFQGWNFSSRRGCNFEFYHQILVLHLQFGAKQNNMWPWLLSLINSAIKWQCRRLWSGSSYRAFVYIGNDGFCFAADCKHNNRKDKCKLLSVSKKFKEFKKWEHLKRLNSLIDTTVIAIVNKKAVNRTVSFDNELVPLNGRIVSLSYTTRVIP